MPDANEIYNKKRKEFIELVKMCKAFKESIDFHEMQDITVLDKDSEEYKRLYALKTNEDKVQQLLYEEYKANKHSTLFDEMQDEIMKSRNGNLIGSLLLMKLKKHDLEDVDKIICACLKTMAGRETIEEAGKQHPNVLRLTERVVSESGNYKYMNQACYIDGINVNKIAKAVMGLNNLENLQDFGEEHVDDLSGKTRKMMSDHFKCLESGMHKDEVMVRCKHD